MANFQLDQNRRPEQKCVAVAAQSVFAQAGFALFLLLLYNLVLIKVKKRLQSKCHKQCNFRIISSLLSRLRLSQCPFRDVYDTPLDGAVICNFSTLPKWFQECLTSTLFLLFHRCTKKYAQCCSRHLKPKSTASAMLSERRLCLACLHFSTQHSSGNFSRRLHFPIAYFSRAPLLLLCVAPRLAHICCGGVPVSRVYLLPLKV